VGYLPVSPEGGSTELVRRGFSRAGRVKKSPGGFHQVDGLAAGTPEPPLEIASSRSRLRRLRVRLMEDRSPTVTTGLSSVIDLERLGAVATRIAAAVPKRTIPTSPLHRVGAAHRTCDDAGLNLFGSWGGGIHSGWPPASTGLFSQQLLEAAVLSEAASRGDLDVAPDGFRWSGDGHPYSFETQTGPK
jgi:hypothetical protein